MYHKDTGGVYEYGHVKEALAAAWVAAKYISTTLVVVI